MSTLKQKNIWDNHSHPRGMLGKTAWNKGLTKETDERVKKISLSHFGKKHSQETIEKMRQYALGRKPSEDTKLKRKLSILGRKATEETRRKLSLIHIGKPSPFKGKHHTEEAKRKIGEKNLGKKVSKEQIEKFLKKRMTWVVPMKDTSIEVILQKSLIDLEINFEKHRQLLGICQSDIFIAPNIVIFADGCYWHGCEKCFDVNKMSDWIRKRKIADLVITQKLTDSGYRVIRFWEHDIKNNFEEKVLDEIVFTINENKVANNG